MCRIIISGCNGYMGRAVSSLCSEDEGIKVVAGFDINLQRLFDYPVYQSPEEYIGEADVLIDFSHPDALVPLLDYCVKRGIPVVLCTTGYTDTHLEHIKSAANRIPIFKSANMSIGINMLLELTRRAAFLLGDDFDIEIVEKHHNRKIDAPSGTALMLADAAKKGMNYSPDLIYDRSEVRRPRGKNEIGISAVRGGTIPGEHSVIFAGTDEVIEFKHTVFSRDVFAKGAVRAAKFLSACTEPGMYSMSDALQ
ncbi:MAG: 4-hydroxy-tetrahydrodipicolinate reductase [Clostridiales bacterium]|nr:4-hydroxy-tetrahydrodipicolinate reductase [Clostridiales bacterium]